MLQHPLLVAWSLQKLHAHCAVSVWWCVADACLVLPKDRLRVTAQHAKPPRVTFTSDLGCDISQSSLKTHLIVMGLK